MTLGSCMNDIWMLYALQHCWTCLAVGDEDGIAIIGTRYPREWRIAGFKDTWHGRGDAIEMTNDGGGLGLWAMRK